MRFDQLLRQKPVTVSQSPTTLLSKPSLSQLGSSRKRVTVVSFTPTGDGQELITTSPEKPINSDNQSDSSATPTTAAAEFCGSPTFLDYGCSNRTATGIPVMLNPMGSPLSSSAAAGGSTRSMKQSVSPMPSYLVRKQSSAQTPSSSSASVMNQSYQLNSRVNPVPPFVRSTRQKPAAQIIRTNQATFPSTSSNSSKRPVEYDGAVASNSSESTSDQRIPATCLTTSSQPLRRTTAPKSTFDSVKSAQLSVPNLTSSVSNVELPLSKHREPATASHPAPLTFVRSQIPPVGQPVSSSVPVSQTGNQTRTILSTGKKKRVRFCVLSRSTMHHYSPEWSGTSKGTRYLQIASYLHSCN